MVKRNGQIVNEHGWNLISHLEEIIGTYCSVFVCSHRKILLGHNFFSFDTNHTCGRACWRKKRSSSFSAYTRSSQDVQIWKWTSSKNTQEPADMWPMSPVVKSRMWNCIWQQCESHGSNVHIWYFSSLFHAAAIPCLSGQTSSGCQKEKLGHWIISSEKYFIFLRLPFPASPTPKNEGGGGALKIPPRASPLMGSYLLFLSALLFRRPGRRQWLPFSSPLASTTTCPTLIPTT